MITELKENIPHGTKEYPYDHICVQKIRHAFQVPVHWHEEMEIIYVCEGMLHVKISGQDFDGKPGDFFFVNSRELHLMETQDLRVKYYTLLFPLSFVSFQTMDELETELLMPLRQRQLMLPVNGSMCRCAPRLRALLDEVIRVNDEAKEKEKEKEQEKGTCFEETKSRRMLWLQMETRMLILQLLQELVMEDALVPVVRGGNTDMPKELLVYIQEHYTEKLTLADLSAEFHLSPKYISRYFKQHFSLPFSDYVIHLRLSHARELLETTELAVTDVALQAGFSDVSYFIRRFKAAYDISPLQYRKSVNYD